VEILTTHVGADFDALAAVLVLRKLYPGAVVFFPGSREESVRRMLEAGLVQFDEVRQREIDPDSVRRVILCDCRQRDRLGVVADWVAARPGIEVLAYDHHPDSPNDLPASGGLIDPQAGSTSTLLVEELRRRSLEVNGEEATLLLLGLYEDSGSLTHATTGPRDLEAAAWLLRQGADLGAVRRFAVRRLDAPRLDLLHRMVQGLEIHRLREHRIGLVALEVGHYLDELAPLVSRCLEMSDVPVLFALFGEGERVTVIARGELGGFDLGGALAEFAGGGGHATAAAASVRGQTAIEVRERLLEFLPRVLPPVARAADLMVETFVTVEEGSDIEGAKLRLLEGRVNAAPVVDAAGRVAGVVTRQALDAAIQHRLGERPVSTAMSREVEWVPPSAPADELAARMVGARPRLVLVGDPESGRPLGVVSRMAVLTHLYGRLQAAADPAERRAREQRAARSQAGRLLGERAPVSARRRIETATAVSRQTGIPVYLVGGFVRDLLLGHENRDLDLVVEGDGLHFARRLAEALGGRAREHPAFLTAVVVDRDGEHIDVATARSEFYRAPAALPEVQSSALRQDLLRRDFTINTLAIRLGPEPALELIDYFGGRKDLEEKTIRVLHSLSLIDDPTRVLRAVRLEARLGFHLSPETRRLIAIALAEGVFDRLSSARLRDELYQLLDEPSIVVRALERLEELGLLGVLHPRLRLGDALRESIQAAIAAWDWYSLAGLSRAATAPRHLLLLTLALSLDDADRPELADRLSLAGRDRERLLAAPPRLAEAAAALDRQEAPHLLARALRGLQPEEMLSLFAAGGEGRRARLRAYWTELEPVRLVLRGTDLLARGVPSGPLIGQALEETLDARLDGRIDATQELDFALAALRRGAPAPVAAGKESG
jgi:tRNA nucleotidyltransferase (CCA-adding enzyme)